MKLTTETLDAISDRRPCLPQIQAPGVCAACDSRRLLAAYREAEELAAGAIELRRMVPPALQNGRRESDTIKRIDGLIEEWRR